MVLLRVPPALVLVPPPPPNTQAIEFSLFEEAFEIYKKFGKKVNAIQVLLNNLQDLDRAHEYANKVRIGRSGAAARGIISTLSCMRACSLCQTIPG